MTKRRSKAVPERPPGLPHLILAASGPGGSAVIVLGAEGAGLAPAAGCLALLGCDLPRDLLAVGPAEGRGAWESGAVAALARPSPADARAALEAAFGPAPLPLLKGAGLADALPAWLAALDATGRGAAVVLVHGLLAPDADEEAWDAWIEGSLRAERASRGLCRAVCDRDRLLANWRGEAGRLGERLGLDWPTRAAGEAAADAFAAAARAPASGPGPRPPGHAARRLAAILARWAEDGENPADHPDLDRLARKLGLDGLAGPGALPAAAWPESPAPAAAEAALRALRAAEEARAEAEGRLADALDQLARSEGMRLDDVGAAEAATRGALDAQARLEDRLAQAEASLAEAGHQRDHLASALRQSRHEASEHHEARAGLAARLQELDADLAALRAERDRARGGEAEAGRERARLEAELERARTELAERIADLDADLATVRRERDEARGAEAEASRARALLGEELDRTRAERDAGRLREAEAARGRSRLEEELERERAARGADLGRLARLGQDLAVLKREALGELAARLASLPTLAAAAPGEPKAEVRSGEAEALAARLRLAERQAEKRSAEAAALAARLKDAEREARHARGQAEAALAEVEAIRLSTSWRLTTPLRSALGALRRR